MGLNRDQQRAQWAYASAEEVAIVSHDDYKITVNDLGANIIRSGLAASIAFLQRDKSRDVINLLLKQLAQPDALGDRCSIPAGLSPSELAAAIRGLELNNYMLATREILALATWLKRAIQATFTGTPDVQQT